MKVAIAPGVWRDDGPQSASAKFSGFAVQAVTGDRMVPVLRHDSGTNPITVAETARRARRNLKRVYVPLPARPVCGVVLKVIGEPCARRPGHKFDHRSRALMDSDMEVRRSGWRHSDGVE